ncbi:OLC1v1001985C1 [Oldenlandia corymbosa var. corymbosa]|uniref:OLC1v1001985C1 n=1 Tax=Oldenlandia corymbosa var. corymbosa TaxID=529605 RepID=A0AAV1D929_OLDCO|nr:OLC1v1001985C1 [Oldenlandia corymbosa var. corymbosa]
MEHSTVQLGFVDSVLAKLTDLTGSELSEQISYSKLMIPQVKSFRHWLGQIENMLGQDELRTLWNRVLEAMHKLDSLIGDSSSTMLGSIKEEMDEIESDIELKKMEMKMKEKEIPTASSQLSTARRRTDPSTAATINQAVGFAEEERSIEDQLTRGGKGLKMVAIVGMAGQGKTFLANRIFNRNSISHHFPVRAWCVISEKLNNKEVLSKLLNQTTVHGESKREEEDLKEELRKSLKGRRYLIVLDDVWYMEAWNSLRACFPDDNVGSRILVTSRSNDVVFCNETHRLRSLNEEESFELLRSHLSQSNNIGVDGWTSDLNEIVAQIATSCCGLPLTMVVVAGLLKATNYPEGWQEIRDDFIRLSGSSVMDSVQRSYDPLPQHLRKCFLYFGTIPRNKEISVGRLLYMWIAEGFVEEKCCNGKFIEDVAAGYLKDLTDRSLIEITKQRWDGGVKKYGIHDLLFDFCLNKAKEEHFFHVGEEQNGSNEPSNNFQRQCFHQSDEHFHEGFELLSPSTCSLIFTSSKKSVTISWDVILGLKHLKVLDLQKTDVCREFLSKFELLGKLTFLAIKINFRRIPSSVAGLPNLETLIVVPNAEVELPDGLWNLQELRYLHIQYPFGILPAHNLEAEGSTVLNKLDRLDGAFFPSRDSMQSLMTKYPNIRRLKCKVFARAADDPETLDKKIVFPDSLSQLQSIRLLSNIPSGSPVTFTYELILPGHLRKLSLFDFALSWANLSTIGTLPNLQILKLTGIFFEGETWEMKEGKFSKLESFKLRWPKTNLIKWSTSCDDDHQLSRLKKLAFCGCKMLEDIPSDCLKSLDTLERIHACRSSKRIKQKVEEIKEEHKELGTDIYCDISD